MRERLFKVIQKLEDCGWSDNREHKLISNLRHIAENFSPELIEEILEAFRHA